MAKINKKKESNLSNQQNESSSNPRGWSGFHRIYYNAAVRSLSYIDTRRNELIDLFSKLNDGDFNKLVPEYLEKQEEYLTLLNTTQIYCGMAVEALLNLYGVKQLGESFYKRNLERIGIIPKLELLLATCDNYLLPKNAEITTVLRHISETRNALVHPKSFEHKEEEEDETGRSFDEQLVIVKQSVADMKKFFELFSAISVETKTVVEMFKSRDNIKNSR